MSLLTIKRVGLFSGPLLGLLCYHLLPLHYSTASGQWLEFTQAGRATLGLMAWMATWWVTEAVDIEVTALLPIAIFPLAGIAPLSMVLPPCATDVIFLFMGGFMTVTAFLSMWVSNTMCAAMMTPIAFRGFAGLPPILLLLAITAMTVFLSELTSNPAQVATMLPVLAAMAPMLGMKPYVLIVACTLGASSAYMMPVGTPPNAIVFGTGLVRMPQMMKAGVWLNLAGILVITVLCALLL